MMDEIEGRFFKYLIYEENAQAENILNGS